MSDRIQPTSTGELAELLAAATRDKASLALRGGGSKDRIGAKAADARVVDMRAFAGVSDYDPPELVLTTGAGTLLSDIESLVAAEGQMLAFDPFDHGRLLGVEPGRATIGGVVAAGVAGPRRLSGGSARDHLLGFEAVSGDGRTFRAGAKVVKNVTGFDLSKLVAGSWGRLVALTEVTLKVVPRPEASLTLCVRGLEPTAAVRLMTGALGSTAAIAAAAHVPAGDGPASTLLRIDGIDASIASRRKALLSIVPAPALADALDDSAAATAWNDVRDVSVLPTDRPLWRVLLPAAQAPAFVAALDDSAWLMDWAGGLLWVATAADAHALRVAAQEAGGHAMLVRADAALRAGVPALHPPSPAVAALEARVRQAFDPGNVFANGRF